MAPFDTARLHLRPLREGDEALYRALYTDPAVMARIGEPLPPEAARRQFAQARRLNDARPGTERRWAVTDRPTGDARGLLALLRDPADPANVELGVMLLPGAQGRGFARELCSAVLARAFGPGGWGLRRVWARHAPGHAAAAAALGAAGFLPAPPLGSDATMDVTRDRWPVAAA